MLRTLSLCLAILMPVTATAQSEADITAAIVDDHILPRYAALVVETMALAEVADSSCQPGDPALQAAFHDAFDAWIAVSHITFGPAETDGRYFALSFWPDTRSMTGRSLSTLIADADPIVSTAEDYATVSVAARGFYALEFLLFDPEVSTAGEDAYRCALVQAITADIAATAAQIEADWTGTFAALMRGAGSNDRFQSPDEALRVLFGSLTTGLEFTADLRLGRPLGTFDAPRAARAEARRSGRSLRHVELSLQSLADLADRLATGDPGLRQALADRFDIALDNAARLDDPIFAGVDDPQGRLRVEALQQRVQEVRDLVSNELGPKLGVAAGFNSLDGD